MQTYDTSSAKLSLLEILDRTFRFYRENLAQYLVITAAVLVPIAVLQSLFGLTTLSQISSSARLTAAQTSQLASQVCGAGFLTIIFALIQNIVLIGTITYVTSEKHLGRNATFGAALSATSKRIVPLIVGNILFVLVIFVVFFAGGLVAVACPPIFAAIIGLAIYIGVPVVGLLTPVLLLEDVSASLGVNRAFGLGKRRFWTICGFFIILGIITAILGAAIGIVLTLVAGTNTSSSTYQMGYIIANLIVAILTTPLTPIGQTVLYYDTRNRFEGLDLALASSSAPEPRPSDVDSPRAIANLGSQDIVNVVILIVIAVILVVLLRVSTDTLLRFLPGAGSLPR